MGNNYYVDLHNHTTFSDGYHSAERIITNAIDNKLDAIGISDHFFTSKCNSVSPLRLFKYIEELKSLKDKYKDKIQVQIGIEICMKKDWCRLEFLDYESLNKLDYILFEYVDFFPDSVTLKDLNMYSSKITCRKGLAHTDLLEVSEKYGIDETIKLLKENNLFWELNVNGGYPYYHDIVKRLKKKDKKVIKLFEKLKAANVEITVGSDTHHLNYYKIEDIRLGNEIARYNLDIVK